MSEDHSKQDCIICSGEITDEQMKRECVGDEVGRNVVTCAGCNRCVFHAACLVEWFSAQGKGFETCPHCQFGIHDKYLEAIVHPNSNFGQLSGIVNYLKCKHLKRMLPEHYNEVEELAERYEREHDNKSVPVEKLNECVEKVTSTIQLLVPIVIARNIHPPISKEYLASKQWKTLKECLDGRWLKPDEDTDFILIEDYVFHHLRDHFDAHVTVLRHQRLRALHEANKEECLRLFKTCVAKKAQDRAALPGIDRASFDSLFVSNAFNVTSLYFCFFTTEWTSRIIAELRQSCGIDLNDVNWFAHVVHKENLLGEDQVREMIAVYNHAADEAFAGLQC